jgi:hypothetical protein
LQDIADVRYIPLGSNNEFLVGDNVRYVLSDPDLICLHTFLGDILIYDAAGNPIAHINRRGQNAGEEYVFVDQLIADKEKEELFVFEPQRFLVYDLKGNFKRRFSIPNLSEYTQFEDFVDYDKDHFIVYAGNNFDPNKVSFRIISKRNGETNKEIVVPFEKIIYTMVVDMEQGDCPNAIYPIHGKADFLVVRCKYQSLSVCKYGCV